MKTLGVFITTNFDPANRNWNQFEQSNVFDYFSKYMMHLYDTLESGLPDGEWDLTLLNTDPKLTKLKDWHSPSNKAVIKSVENHDGFYAGIKHIMHVEPSMMDDYKYFMFHVDDGVEPTANGWATDLIEKYEHQQSFCEMGIMGRLLNNIKLCPDYGLIDHGCRCAHIARIWGLTELEVVPHLHADWWFMNSETLKELASCWNDPMHSPKDMDYQNKWENAYFPQLPAEHKKHIYIGREVDVSLRVTRLMKKGLLTYRGNKFNARPITDRTNEEKRIICSL